MDLANSVLPAHPPTIMDYYASSLPQDLNSINTPWDLCRVMFQYSPFSQPFFSHGNLITVFHPVLYDIGLGVLKLACLLFLIISIKYQYTMIQQNKQDDGVTDPNTHMGLIHESSTTDSILIFPLYLRILIFMAVLFFYQAIIDVVIPLHPRPRNTNPLVNSILHAVGSGLEHGIWEGTALLLTFRGVGRRTTLRTFICALLWAAICGSLATFLNFFSTSAFLTLIIQIVWVSVRLAFFTTLWLAPPLFVHRRPAVIPYARLFSVLHFLELVTQIMFYFHIRAGYCTIHLTQHGVLNAVLPYIIYRMLISDSQYWQGGGEYGESSSDAEDDSISTALLGITFDPNSARHVASQMDKNTRVNMISFAAIRLEKNMSGLGPKHIILGAGSTARVYRGLYFDRRVAIKTILCPELTQEVISSFYREAKLLTSLRHPNVVAVEGMCVNPPALCLVMELCGGSLMDLLSIVYGNSHTSATQQPIDRDGTRQELGRRDKSSSSLKIKNGVASASDNTNLQGHTPYFSYYTDYKTSAKRSTQRKQHGTSQHHGSNRQNTTLSRNNSTTSSTPTNTFPSLCQNLPLLLDPDSIHDFYDLDQIYADPLEFWQDLLRTGYNPVHQELLRSHSNHCSSAPGSYSSTSSTQGSLNGTGNKEQIPPPTSVNPLDTVVSWLSRIELMLQCATAVAFLHEQSPPIMHLDLKSSNYLLGFDGKVKLADLELSRHITIKNDNIPTAANGQSSEQKLPSYVSVDLNKSSSTITPRSTNLLYHNIPLNQNFLQGRTPSMYSPSMVLSPTVSNISASIATSANGTTQRLPSIRSAPTTAFLIDLLSEIVTNGPHYLIAHDMAYRSSFNEVTIPDRVNWLAPELMMGQSYTEKVDIYALGCVLWEIITGKVPFYDVELQLKNISSLPRSISTFYQKSHHNNNALLFNESPHIGALGASTLPTSGNSTAVGYSIQGNSYKDEPYTYSFVGSTSSSTIGSSHMYSMMDADPATTTFVTNTTFVGSQGTGTHVTYGSAPKTPPKSSVFQPSSLNASQQLQSTANLNVADSILDVGQTTKGPRTSMASTLSTAQRAVISTTPTTEQIQSAIKILVSIYHYRPTIPIDTPDTIRYLIEDAWHPDPFQRPTVREMVTRLIKIKNDLLADGGIQHLY